MANRENRSRGPQPVDNERLPPPQEEPARVPNYGLEGHKRPPTPRWALVRKQTVVLNDVIVDLPEGHEVGAELVETLRAQGVSLRKV